MDKILRLSSHGHGVRVASLASGCSEELFAFFGRQPEATNAALCVDLDEHALLAAAQRAQALGVGNRMAFVLGNALPTDDEPVTLQPQHLVYALGPCEYLGDDQTVALLDHCHALLAPDRPLLLSNLAAGQPDRPLLAHLLNAPAHRRSPEDLRALFERAAFAGRPLGVELDEAGVSLYLQSSRAPAG